MKAQTDILVHGSFVPFIDRSSSIQPIDEIFSRTVQNEWRKELEPIRPVHAPWVELTNEHNIMWEPRWQDKYTGPHGGPKAGPTQFIADIVRSAKDLCDIFLAILPLAFFERVAQLTEKYCYDDWVVERRKKDSDGNEMKATDAIGRTKNEYDMTSLQDSLSHGLGFLYFKGRILVLRRGQDEKCGRRHRMDYPFRTFGIQ